MSPVHYVNIQKQQLNINSNNKNNCADYALVKCLFLSLDIADERDLRIRILFFLFSFFFQSMPLNLKILTYHQTSVLHLMFLTSSWPQVDCTSPVMSAFLLGTEQSTNWAAFHNLLDLDLCWLCNIPVDPKRTWLDTARVNLLDIAKINFFFNSKFLNWKF